MQASEIALGLPEIVTAVLSQLQNLELVVLTSTALNTEMSRRTPSLLPCMLVNKLWADEATRLVWSHKVSLPKLLQVRKTRRQYYAQNVQSLHIPSTTDIKNTEDVDDLYTLEWPRLRELTSHLPAKIPKSVFVPALPLKFGIQTPEYEEMGTLKPAVDSHIAWRVSTTERGGSSLSSLEINDDGKANGQGSAPEIISFLEEHPTIRRISLLSVASTRDGTILKYLAARPNVESLSIVLDPCEPAIGTLPYGSFLALKHLSFTGRSDDMVKLASHSAHLRSLRVTLLGTLGTSITQGSIDALLLAFCQWKELETLRFRTKIWGLLSTTQLALKGELLVRLARSCRNLKTLEFDTGSSPDASKVTDDELEQMALTLPSLETLRLPMKPWLSRMTWQALACFGISCRQLECLQLGANIQFDDKYSHDVILFPCLKDLMIGSPYRTKRSQGVAKELMSPILEEHFPRLRTVHIPESVVAGLSDESRILVVGKHGFLPIDPCTDWDSRSMARLGQGSYTLVAKIQRGKLPNFSKELH